MLSRHCSTSPGAQESLVQAHKSRPFPSLAVTIRRHASQTTPGGSSQHPPEPGTPHLVMEQIPPCEEHQGHFVEVQGLGGGGGRQGGWSARAGGCCRAPRGPPSPVVNPPGPQQTRIPAHKAARVGGAGVEAQSPSSAVRPSCPPCCKGPHGRSRPRASGAPPSPVGPSCRLSAPAARPTRSEWL